MVVDRLTEPEPTSGARPANSARTATRTGRPRGTASDGQYHSDPDARVARRFAELPWPALRAPPGRATGRSRDPRNRLRAATTPARVSTSANRRRCARAGSPVASLTRRRRQCGTTTKTQHRITSRGVIEAAPNGLSVPADATASGPSRLACALPIVTRRGRRSHLGLLPSGRCRCLPSGAWTNGTSGYAHGEPR